MDRRWWLVVRADPPGALRNLDWFTALGPIPDELQVGDRIGMICWPARPDRPPFLAATVSVSKLSRETGSLRLRHRVASIDGHEVMLTSLGTRLAAARGWTAPRRDELLDLLHLVPERDLELIEAALLTAAHRFGPPPRRPTHAQPRTPGRRALLAGRASVAGGHDGAR